MSYAEKRAGRLTGKWWGEVCRKGGPRFKRAFESKREADAWEAYVRVRGAEPPGSVPAATTGRTFAAVAAEAKAAGGPDGVWKRGRDPSVIQRLDRLCGTTFGALPIEQVNHAALLAVVQDLEKRPGQRGGPLSPGTINRYLTACSAVCTFALSQEYIERTPNVPWRAEAAQGRFHWLADGREAPLCAALVSAGHAADARCVAFLLATGMRWGELAGLEPGQVADGCVRLWETKTDAPRRIPLEEGLARELRAFVAAGQVPVYVTFRKHFAAAVAACGENPGLTIHCLRHTTCTRLIKAGWPMPKVQRFMGHRSINTTMRYFHMLDADLDDATEILSPRAGNAASADVIEFIPAAKKAS